MRTLCGHRGMQVNIKSETGSMVPVFQTPSTTQIQQMPGRRAKLPRRWSEDEDAAVTRSVKLLIESGISEIDWKAVASMCKGVRGLGVRALRERGLVGAVCFVGCVVY
jgi:hypothetical protein